MASRELNILIKAKNLAGAAIAGVKKDLKGLDQTVGRGIQNAGRNIERGIAAGAVAFGAGVVYSLKAAGDFEAQLNTINTIVKLNETDLKRLGEGIRTTFRETGQPLNDLTAAYYDLLSAGIKVEDAQSVLNTSVKLGIGGMATTEEAVNLLTTAVNAYGLNAKGAAGAADIFAAAVRDGKVTVAEISASFADVAPLAAQYGITLEEIGAAYATLTARGVPAAEVGTQFNRAMIEGLKPGPQLVKVIDALGGSFEDLIRQKGLVQTLQDIRVEAEKQGVPFQDLFGRIEAYKFALATTGPNQAKFLQELEAMGEATGEVNAQFSERQKGLNYQLAKLKANAHDAAITIGAALIPSVVRLAEKVTGWVQTHQPQIKEFAEGLAKALEDAVTWASKLNWDAILGGLGTARDIAKTLLDAFLKMPAWVQTAVITGWGLNKLTGGALGSIVGQLASGLIKGVLGINAGVVNVHGAVVHGPGGGVPGGVGAGGKGFLPTGAMGWAGLLGVAIADAFLVKMAIDEFGNQTEAVEVAADFERSVVEDRSEGATVAELQKLRADLKGEIEFQPTDFIENALKGIFVTPELERQLAEVDAKIALLTAKTSTASSASSAWSARQLAAFSQVTAAQRSTAVNVAAQTSIGRVQQAHLSRIAAKDFSPILNANITVNSRVDINSVTKSLTTKRVAVGMRGGIPIGA